MIPNRLIALTLRTVLDVDAAAAAYDLHGLVPAAIIKAVQHLHRHGIDGASPSPALQRIVVTAAAIVDAKQVTEQNVESADNASERAALDRIAQWLNDDALMLIGWHTAAGLLSAVRCRALRYADAGLTLGHWALASGGRLDTPACAHHDLAAALNQHSVATPHALVRTLGVPVSAPMTADHIDAAWRRGDGQALIDDARLELACILAVYRRYALNVQGAAGIDNTPFMAALRRHEQAVLAEFKP